MELKFKSEDVSGTISKINENGEIYNSLNSQQKKHASEIKLDNYDFDYTFYCKNLDEVLNSARIIVNELGKEAIDEDR